MTARAVMLTNDTLQPADAGGRKRMQALVDALSPAFAMTVVEREALSSSALQRQEKRAGHRTTFQMRPRLSSLVDDGLLRRYTAAAAPGIAFGLISHSYLVPALPRSDLPLIVDFPNLEVRRQASLAAQRQGTTRLVARLESAKAGRWEPAVARRAVLSIAVSDADAEVLRAWGATVCVAPNAADRCCPYEPSPADGYVLFLGDLRYEPNRRAVEDLVHTVWPLVAGRRPRSRLVLAGTGSDAFPVPDRAGPFVERRGYVESVHDCYRGSALVINPVTSGGGTQLKVAEAIAHGRALVTCPYGAASLTAAQRRAAVVEAEPERQAAAIVRLLDDADERNQRGLSLYDEATTWVQALAPLTALLVDRFGTVSRAGGR